MNKNYLIDTFLKYITNGNGTALYSNCGFGYVYECNNKNDCIRVGVNQILWKDNRSTFPFFETKYELSVDEFIKLSKDLPKRLKRIKLMGANNSCTCRNKGSVDIL